MLNLIILDNRKNKINFFFYFHSQPPAPSCVLRLPVAGGWQLSGESFIVSRDQLARAYFSICYLTHMRAGHARPCAFALSLATEYGARVLTRRL